MIAFKLTTLRVIALLLLQLYCLPCCSVGLAAELQPRTFNWLNQIGRVSISEMNVQCDMLLIGTVNLPSEPHGNFLITQIDVNTLIAMKKGVQSEFTSFTTNGNEIKSVFLLGKNPQTEHDTSHTILLPGGVYLLWLTKATNFTLSKTNAGRTFLKPDTSAAFTLTAGRRSAFSLTDPHVLQRRHKSFVAPYPWQEHLLVDCIGTNSVKAITSIAFEIARALRSDIDSNKVLTTLSAYRQTPGLAKIANEHLTKGVTNIFSYTTPRQPE